MPRALAQDVTVAELEPPILVRATKCNVTKPGGDCNYGGTEILGFSAKGVALSYTPESGHPEIWPVVGEVVGLDGTSRERKTITQTGELEGRAYTAARLKGWKWFAAIAKAGYTPPRPLVWAQGMTGGDDFPYEPLAFLKAPLAGWMLYIAPDGEQMVVQLVAPDNQRTYRLASMPSLALGGLQTAARGPADPVALAWISRAPAQPRVAASRARPRNRSPARIRDAFST